MAQVVSCEPCPGAKSEGPGRDVHGCGSVVPAVELASRYAVPGASVVSTLCSARWGARLESGLCGCIENSRVNWKVTALVGGQGARQGTRASTSTNKDDKVPGTVRYSAGACSPLDRSWQIPHFGVHAKEGWLPSLAGKVAHRSVTGRKD